MAAQISQETLAQLCLVLKNLGLSDNNARDQAEQQLNSVWLGTRPDELLLGLVQVARTTEDQVLRAFAPVLLRRLAFKPLPNRPKDQTATPWDVIQIHTRGMVKNELLVALSVEQDKSVRHKLCDCIAEISKSEVLRGESWPEILPALFECSRSPSEGHREAAFRIFAASPDVISEKHVDGLKTVFVGALQDSCMEVRLAALKAAAAFMLDTDPNSRNFFTELITQMFTVVVVCYQNRDEDSVTESIGVLIELAEHVPKTFKAILNHLVELMIQIMSDKTFQDSTRKSALELLLTLTESASAMMRKQQGFGERVIPIALQMMTDIDDEPSWHTGDDSDEDDNEENWAVGEQAMDRLARFLGGKRVVPVSFQYIPGMLGAEQWQQRHAALMAISAIGEGCVKVMTAELGKILDMILPYLRDPHTRVRYAACNAVGQMSTDFGPILQNNFHQNVLSALVPVMDDTANPRVQSHAAAALVNFCEGCDKNVISPYLDAIFERLLILLNTSRTYVQEQAITTIATVADSAEDRFGKYYSSIMPLLMNVLRSAESKEYRMLRGKAMECATLIALAVGKNTFGPDAGEFITLLRQTQESVTEADDPQISFLLSAWARICKVLGQDFVQYLDVVMPPLLKSAQTKPEFAVLDPDDDDNEAKYSAEEGWEFVGIDGQQIGIKTTILEEKCTAVELLGCYAKELGAAFHTYAPQVLEILLPLLRFYFHDGVREAAATCIPRLLVSVKKASYPPEQIHRMWSAIVDRTVEVLNTEADLAFLMSFYSSFSDCIDVLGANCLNADQLGKLTEGLKSQLQDHYERLKQRHEERAAAGEEFDEDDEVWKESEETDEDVLQEVSRVVHTIFKTHGAAYLPHFEGMLPITDAFLVFPNFAAKQWALCVLDDMVEFTGAESWRYHAHFVTQMIECVVSEHVEARQAACYGVGVFGQFGGENFADACAAALPNLFAVINNPNAKDEKNVVVTDNAISAVGKICKYNSSKFDVSAVLPTWFAALPIVNDEEEASHVYEYLLELLDAQHSSILGSNHENIPHLVQIFTSILVSAILPEGLATRVVGSLKAVLNGCTEEMKQQLWGGIAAEDRRSLAQMGYI